MCNTTSFLISGAGGQGVISFGTILASIFMYQDKHVSFIPCYGAEMRGGAVNCEVNMSDNELLCLQKDEIDYVIALNQTSFDKFLPKVKKDGIMILNSSLVQDNHIRNDVQYVSVPMTNEALKLNNVKMTNAIALGVLSRILGGFNENSVQKALSYVLKNKNDLVQKNIEAYRIGYSYSLERELVNG